MTQGKFNNSWLATKHSMSNATLRSIENKKTRHEEYLDCYYGPNDIDNILDDLASMDCA